MTKRSVFLGSLFFISLAGGLFLVSGALAKKYSFSFLKQQAFDFTPFPRSPSQDGKYLIPKKQGVPHLTVSQGSSSSFSPARNNLLLQEIGGAELANVDCYKQGEPTGETGFNTTAACDGLHTECRTDSQCIGTGLCFWECTGTSCQCIVESCLGKCSFDAFIWDITNNDCGCSK